MSRPVTLIAWRNANPYPEADVPTGPGRDVLVFPPGQGIRWDDTRHVMEDSASVGAEPYWWSDPPSPPDMNDPLTVEDLRLLLTWAPSRSPEAARLRRALDQISNTEKA